MRCVHPPLAGEGGCHALGRPSARTSEGGAGGVTKKRRKFSIKQSDETPAVRRMADEVP